MQRALHPHIIRPYLSCKIIGKLGKLSIPDFVFSNLLKQVFSNFSASCLDCKADMHASPWFSSKLILSLNLKEFQHSPCWFYETRILWKACKPITFDIWLQQISKALWAEIKLPKSNLKSQGQQIYRQFLGYFMLLCMYRMETCYLKWEMSAMYVIHH